MFYELEKHKKTFNNCKEKKKHTLIYQCRISVLDDLKLKFLMGWRKKVGRTNVSRGDKGRHKYLLMGGGKRWQGGQRSAIFLQIGG